MKKTTIYTNGNSLFTLENYGKTSGVSELHGIKIHSIVNKIKARAMHESGELHYIFGTGDRKELNGATLNRKMNFNNFYEHVNC